MWINKKLYTDRLALKTIQTQKSKNVGKFRYYLVGYLGYDGSGDEENEKGDGNDLKSYRVRRGWVFYCNLLT